MNLETINPYVLKILIAIKKEDSVIGISKRINLSFGWTYKWVKELVKEGIIKERWRGVVLQEDNKNYKKILKFIKEIQDIRFYYSVLNLFGVRYCFEKTDAVYIWTEGGYNIARYKEFYPIFIKIKRENYPVFLQYCKKLNLKVKARKGIFYVPEVLEDFKCVKKKDLFVEPLDETIEFMKKNIYNFQPALEMIQEMYGMKLGIKYKESSLM